MAERASSKKGGDGDAASISLPVVDGAACRGKHTTIRKSKSGPRRAIVLAVVQVLMIAHLIQWAVTGRTLSPVEPSESMEFVKHGIVNAGAIFFALALLSTLVFGRWFCGWGCHLVMLQDLCAWMMKKIGIRPKPFRARLLLYVPFVLALYMFVWPAAYRLGVAPLSAWLHDMVAFVPALPPSAPWHGVTSEIITEGFWDTFPTWVVAIPFLLVCGFATVYFLGAKGLCTYACPYGGFFTPVDQYSPARIRVTDACEQCGHCTAVCTSNVRVHEEVHAYGMVVDPGCMKCLDCVSVCPNDALYYGFGKPAVMRGAPRAAEPKRHYDLTWPEEIGLLLVFTAAFLAVRGVYGVVPMLMAAGVAICVTWIAWKAWRCLRDDSANLHRFRLKYHGTLTRSGYVFLALATLVLAVTAHSGVVNVLRAGADRADWRVTVPKHQVFTVNRMAIPAAMDADAATAIRRFELADAFWRGGIGLLPYRDTDLRTTWLYACRGDLATAETRLRRYLSRYETEPAARDLALILFARLRNDEAEALYVEMLEAHPDWSLMSDDFAQWLESEGRVDEAIAWTETALTHQPAGSAEHLLVMRRLSLLRRAAGDLDGSIELIRETVELDDGNPYAYGALAETLALRGDFSEAALMMERAIALADDQRLPAAQRSIMHRQLAVMYGQLGRTADAVHHEAEADRLEASDSNDP